MEPIITVKNIGKRFEDDHPLTALEHIDLEVRRGEFFVLVGPSGSGKSTLLRIMSGLEKDYSGTLTVGVSPDKVSFVFQTFALLPWLTVKGNIELGLLARGMSLSERTKVSEALLHEFGLHEFRDMQPHALSGGQRQRVGIARALATDPEIIFMDEPFSELDSFTATRLRNELVALWEKRRLTVVMVTHLAEEAVLLSDRIVALSALPGRIEKIIENPLPRPRNRHDKEFSALEDELYRVIKP